jgi:hypothetical protein
MTMDSGVFIGLSSLTSLALTVTGVLAWRTRRFMARAVRVPGRIARISVERHDWEGYGSDHPPETTYSYTPHVSFSLEDGSTIEFRSRVSHPRSPLYNEGQIVSVVYERSNPAATAEIAGPAVWRSAIFSGIGTIVLLLVTVLGKACA